MTTDTKNKLLYISLLIILFRWPGSAELDKSKGVESKQIRRARRKLIESHGAGAFVFVEQV